jgi:hypothetical protein
MGEHEGWRWGWWMGEIRGVGMGRWRWDGWEMVMGGGEIGMLGGRDCRWIDWVGCHEYTKVLVYNFIRE